MKFVLSRQEVTCVEHRSCPLVVRIKIVGSSVYGQCVPEMGEADVHTFDWKYAKTNWSQLNGEIGMLTSTESIFVSRNNVEEENTRVLLDKSVYIPGGRSSIEIFEHMSKMGRRVERIGNGEYDYNYYLSVSIEKPACGVVSAKAVPLVTIAGNSGLYVRYK